MKRLLAPRQTAIVELLDGRKVRIVSMNPDTKQVKVKSLATGLPFFVQEGELRLPS